MIKIKYFLLIVLIGITFVSAQDADLVTYLNTAGKMLENTNPLTVGGYAQVDFNQPFGDEYRHNGTLDVHRLVLMLGYKFNERTHFITEIEIEHVEEVYLEQAFLNYQFLSGLSFRGGLMLIPMGIINEYHEPPSYNGVERPLVDTYISPTTWRELGFGITGTVLNSALGYQLYVVNGFNGYDGTARLSGKNGLRKGRQKGAESYISAPNLAGRIEWQPISGLALGFSAYLGDTQSVLYDGVAEADTDALTRADSSVVSVTMVGLDMRYQFHGLKLRGQYYRAQLSNAEEYNTFTGSDLGEVMTGYYIDTGYNVFQTAQFTQTELVPFVRYENYDTHNSVPNGLPRNPNYNVTQITAGFGWWPVPGAVVKTDIQWRKSDADSEYHKIFNAGIGIWF